ncbi:MAG TPA: hypothetical protein VHV75_09930 [Solirubrobacteraceae bacterium]|jgi:hypothetical protein|nr:hypothetical protein [Solirubrobacteraceae bacterium]
MSDIIDAELNKLVTGDSAFDELALATVPGALEINLCRELPEGDLFFEAAPAGWLTADGEIRRKDHRAYYWAPTGGCPGCEGVGRVPSEKRPAPNTIQCPQCKGSGEPGRSRLVSVTTLLEPITNKGGLPRWYEARGIEGTVVAYQRGLIEPEVFPEDVVEIVRGAKLGAENARDNAATRGLNVHALLEEYMLTGNGPRMGEHLPEHHGYIQSLCSWLLAKDPEPESVEQLVCSPVNRYAGRRDLVARVDGRRIGYDAKTQENGGIYLGAHLQVRLYEDAAVEIGDDPCDDLAIVVFAANGEWREMECQATAGTAHAALTYYGAVRPIESACEGQNRIERQARR